MMQVYTFWNPVSFENGILPYITSGLLSKEELINDISSKMWILNCLQIKLEYS